MESENNYSVIRLFNLLAIDGGEKYFTSIANSFESKNVDVKKFLRQKAVISTKLNTASTYLVVSYENNTIDILGYFSLATKMLTLKQSALTKTERRIISRFGYFDEESASFKLPAILIAQFIRNFNKNSKSIKGSNLMKIVLKQVKDIQHLTSGKTIFLECEQNKKIIDFYTECGFQMLDSTVITKDKKTLVQLYMIL